MHVLKYGIRRLPLFVKHLERNTAYIKRTKLHFLFYTQKSSHWCVCVCVFYLLKSAEVGLLRKKFIVQTLFQCRPLGGTEVLQKKNQTNNLLTFYKQRHFSVTHEKTTSGYHSSSGVFLAVILSSQPQHVLRTVKKLGEAVELAVAEVDGSLKEKKKNNNMGLNIIFWHVCFVRNQSRLSSEWTYCPAL